MQTPYPGLHYCITTAPLTLLVNPAIDKIITMKNAWAMVSMISYLKNYIKIIVLKRKKKSWEFLEFAYQRSVYFERAFWFFQFSQKTNEKFLPQLARAKINIFKFVFWEN